MKRRFLLLIATCLLAAAACQGTTARCDPSLSVSYDPTTPEPDVSELEEYCENGCALANLAAGYAHTCGQVAGGLSLCFGDDRSGALGEPIEMLAGVKVGRPLANGFAAGAFFTCTVVSGRPVCFGAGFERSGALLASGGRFLDFQGTIRTIAAGGAHLCIIEEPGDVSCMGDNRHGQIGDATGDGELQAIAGLPSPVYALALGGMHTCAIAGPRSDVYCFGDNRFGALGIGSGEESVSTPTRVEGVSDVVVLAAGAHHTCAATLPNFDLYCWGRGLAGELGTGRRSIERAPVRVGQVSGALQMALGGVPYRLVDGVPTEIDEGVDGFTMIAIGEAMDATDAGVDAGIDLDAGPSPRDAEPRLDDAGDEIDESFIPQPMFGSSRDLLGFGSNAFGQLGVESRQDIVAPILVRHVPDLADMTAGAHHACVATYSDGAYCLGDMSNGQTGVADADGRLFGEILRPLLLR